MSAADRRLPKLEQYLQREWLSVNNAGGFASSTVCSLNTRKYHGLLIAAMSPPVRRMVILSRVEELLRDRYSEETTKPETWQLGCGEYPGAIHPRGHEHLQAFSNDPHPRWAYQCKGWTLEKSLRLLRGSNAVCLSYTLLGTDRPYELELRPMMALRNIHAMTYQWNGQPGIKRLSESLWQLPATARTPEVFFAHSGSYDPLPIWNLANIYRREQDRGYAALEDLWSPGVIRWKLTPGHTAHFVCAVEPLELANVTRELERQYEQRVEPISLPPDQRVRSEMSEASEQYLVTTKASDAPLRRCMLMTQYPWAAPSMRDGLQALPGLLLTERRLDAAAEYLLQVRSYLRQGLLPSELPEDGSTPKYDNADVALWWINAVYEYVEAGGDLAWVREHLWDAIGDIIQGIRTGNGFVRCDTDGLPVCLVPGATWMNARLTGAPADKAVVNPRTGRCVDIVALWYNALRIHCEIARRLRLPDSGSAEDAQRVRHAFGRIFWRATLGYCNDVVDGETVDASLRPNQLLAASLPFAVLDSQHHRRMLDVIRLELLTPVGLRTLACGEKQYRGRLDGDTWSRDRAAHNGSVHPWLLAHYFDALARVNRDFTPEAALRMLQPLLNHLKGEGIGKLPELFDGDTPHRPGGAIASALSLASTLQSYARHVLRERHGEQSTPPLPTPQPRSVR